METLSGICLKSVFKVGILSLKATFLTISQSISLTKILIGLNDVHIQ